VAVSAPSARADGRRLRRATVLEHARRAALSHLSHVTTLTGVFNLPLTENLPIGAMRSATTPTSPTTAPTASVVSTPMAACWWRCLSAG
jgi:hypothetical protein